jgi:hypothetical protein
MFGCLGRLGCLVLIVAMAGGAYITRHRWLPHVVPGKGSTMASAEWKPVSLAGAERARRALARLGADGGPVYANVAPEDLASYVLDTALVAFVEGGRTLEAAVRDDALLLRVTLSVADLNLENVPFVGRLKDRTAVVSVEGPLSVVAEGQGELRVRNISVDAYDVPGPATTRVTRAVAGRLKLQGRRDDAIGFSLPAQIADLRVNRGTITLYKAAR